MEKAYFIGIDVGTQGARINLIDEGGTLVAMEQEVFELTTAAREEQSPQMWWKSCLRALSGMLEKLDTSVDKRQIVSLAVTSTSGTVIPLDENHEPLHAALMYSDKRPSEQASRCSLAAKEAGQDYHNFGVSTGLAKMVWFVEEYPEKAAKLHLWAHAADFITGKICGRWGITDYTNALKSGFDVEKLLWPEYLFDILPLKKDWLPAVVPSGKVIGTIDRALAQDFGLPETIKVVAGITDGCASQIASGAVNLGEWNTTIGTTLVVKGVTENQIKDPEGRLYSHRHPMGYWMPGGASNTGADWVTHDFGNDLSALTEAAATLLPSRHLAYPLRQAGERFPFVAPHARGFEPDGLSNAEKFLANMEGVAYLERYAYEMIEELSGEKIKAVFTAGGGSNSEPWLMIRSNVLNLPLYKMKHVSGAVGAAILAASYTYFDSLMVATKALTQVDRVVRPQERIRLSYEENYKNFIQLLHQKGYIKEKVNA
ncbi:FGGY-family carbohydrate kinase [Dyadobacter tibetensis]|uniref:FGGY-family carbohydrate kinase n=1 Tax=Dyadobacter tibetensis TaxID=1211851 RepID=UPI0004711FBB|nr:FGGY-family carbohydrate kinase [Dyadobacter tibetensis]